MHAIWGLGLLSLTKSVVVVDEWVDVHDYEEVFFRVCANVDPKRDVLLSGGPARPARPRARRSRATAGSSVSTPRTRGLKRAPGRGRARSSCRTRSRLWSTSGGASMGSTQMPRIWTVRAEAQHVYSPQRSVVTATTGRTSRRRASGRSASRSGSSACSSVSSSAGWRLRSERAWLSSSASSGCATSWALPRRAPSRRLPPSTARAPRLRRCRRRKAALRRPSRVRPR